MPLFQSQVEHLRFHHRVGDLRLHVPRTGLNDNDTANSENRKNRQAGEKVEIDKDHLLHYRFVVELARLTWLPSAAVLFQL